MSKKQKSEDFSNYETMWHTSNYPFILRTKRHEATESKQSLNSATLRRSANGLKVQRTYEQSKRIRSSTKSRYNSRHFKTAPYHPCFHIYVWKGNPTLDRLWLVGFDTCSSYRLFISKRHLNLPSGIKRPNIIQGERSNFSQYFYSIGGYENSGKRLFFSHWGRLLFFPLTRRKWRSRLRKLTNPTEVDSGFIRHLLFTFGTYLRGSRIYATKNSSKHIHLANSYLSSHGRSDEFP